MRPAHLALALAAVLLAGLVVVVPVSPGYSDGIAGASGAIEERLRKCQGVAYCKVVPAGCGSCHGDRDAMSAQRSTAPGEPANVPVIDRIRLDVKIDGSPDFKEYEPGRSYAVDLEIRTDRAVGRYNAGGFNLNVSGGHLAKADPGDDGVRITGGVYQHWGSKNDTLIFNGRRYGADEVDESEWAGEATHTATGAERRSWSLAWTAPGKETPHGVAFQAAFMVPDGNGWDNGCTYNSNETGHCDSDRGHSDQDGWDWWYFHIPLLILCERGQDRQTCFENVLTFIRPPPPPLDTCPNSATTCVPSTAADGAQYTPGPSAWALWALLFLAWTRRKGQRPQDTIY